MPTLQELATKFGVDLATINPEFATAVTTEMTGAITSAQAKLDEATRARQEAERNLVLAQQERTEVDTFITGHAAERSELATLRANEAGMRAQLEAIKKNNGIDVTLPDSPKPTAKPAEFDATQFRGDVGAFIGSTFDANNEHIRLFGKPVPDSLDKIADEAKANRMSPAAWMAKKYDFAGEKAKQDKAAFDKNVADEVAKGVQAYKDANPVTSGNPDMTRGEQSRRPIIVKPMSPKDSNEFANLSPRERIQRSLQRSTAAIDAQRQSA